MEHLFSFIMIIFHLHHLLITLLLITTSNTTLAYESACRTTCGSLPIKYPFGSGSGCGSPHFHPYVTCSQDGANLLLTTHTGSYPISSISYSTSAIVIAPPSMSTCASMHHSPNNFGLDWASPFQLGPSTFLLLSCSQPSTTTSSPVCDASYSHLCTAIYACPAVTELGLPLFPPVNTCCVYSPGNLDGNGELDLHGAGGAGPKCNAFSSVVSLGQYPTDPTQWEFGVVLKYGHSMLDDDVVDMTKCKSCEMSDGVCGYAPPGNSFVCVCKKGFNTTLDCNINNLVQDVFLDFASSTSGNICFRLLAVLLIISFLGS